MDTPSTAFAPAVSSLLEDPGPTSIATRGSTEILGKPKRRGFTLACKRRIVALASSLPAGEIGALLRREGLYSSHLTHWRRLFAQLDAKTPEPRRGRMRAGPGSLWASSAWLEHHAGKNSHARRPGRPCHLGRLGTPAKIGELVAFLAMERSRCVARQAIDFTGGWP